MKVFGFAGWSGSGKTTLIEALIPRFVREGVSVSLMKHAHHDFDVDQPGKDSYRHRHAGCKEVLVTSDVRWALMHELRGDPEPGFEQLIERMTKVDLLLIEGWKWHPMPKLEIHRQANGKRPLYPEDDRIIAVASDVPLDTRLPRFSIEDHERITSFILHATGFK